MIYVYALTDPSPAGAIAAIGLHDASLRSVSRRGIAAIYSRHREDRVVLTKENLLRHEQVSEAVMDRADLLPARFGTTFPTEEKLCEGLERHAAPLRAGLERVRQCIELGLRVLWQPSVLGQPNEVMKAVHSKSAPEQSGREYMLARLEKERESRRQMQEADRLARALQMPLTALARESSWRVLETPALLLTAAYLVRRDRVASFRSHVQSLSAGHPELRLLCTGPWPPYNFAPALPAKEPRDA